MHLDRKSWRKALVTLVSPFLVYLLAKKFGVHEVEALMLTAVPAVLVTLIPLWKERKLNVFGLLILIGIVVRLTVAIISGNPRMTLLSDAFVLLGFAFVCVESMMIGRPLMYYFLRQLRQSIGRSITSSLWQQPLEGKKQKIFMKITAVWAIGLVLGALIQAIVIFHVAVSFALLIDHGLEILVMLIFGLWTRNYLAMHREKEM